MFSKQSSLFSLGSHRLAVYGSPFNWNGEELSYNGTSVSMLDETKKSDDVPLKLLPCITDITKHDPDNEQKLLEWQEKNKEPLPVTALLLILNATESLAPGHPELSRLL